MEVQNFTIEGWFYTKSVAAGTPTIITKRNSNADFAPWLVRRNAAGINLFMSENGATYDVSATGGSLVIDTWYHLAFVRNNTDIAVYIDGIRTLGASVSQSYSVRNIAAPIVLGGDTNTNYFNGSLDMVRITKGVARYTSDFTPPAYPFRNY